MKKQVALLALLLLTACQDDNPGPPPADPLDPGQTEVEKCREEAPGADCIQANDPR